MTEEPLPEEPLADEPDPEGEPLPEEPRRYPSTIGGAFYLAILVTCVVGLALVATGRWRGGVEVMAGALGGAAALRLVLPSRDAGMLAVRHRAFDVALLAGLCGLLLFLALSIPDQPG